MSRALAALVVLLAAATADAQEMIEVPNAPPPPPCCAVAEEKRSPPSLLASVLVGPTYRRAFDDDWTAALIEFEIGAQNESFGMGARISAAFGANRYRLPFQMATFGPAGNFRLSSRLRLALAATFGVFSYDRATRAGGVVWAFTLGANAQLSVDLVRSRRGALFALGRVGYDYIETAHSSTSPHAAAATLALGYRF